MSGLDDFTEYGKALVALGEALQEPNTRFRDLTDLATAAGIELTFRVVQEPVREEWLDRVIPLDTVWASIRRVIGLSTTYRELLVTGRSLLLMERGVGPSAVYPLDKLYKLNGHEAEWLGS